MQILALINYLAKFSVSSQTPLTVILFGMFLLLVILGTIIVHRKRDWMITHVYCPPDILFFDTAEERSDVCKRAFSILIRRPIAWILLLIYSGIAATVREWLLPSTVVWFKALPGNEEVNRFLCFLFTFIPLFFPWLLLGWQERRWMRKYLRTYLNEHGMPICMKCGYDLRGLTEQRCPECGKSFE